MAHKISSNIERDAKARTELESQYWNVIIIWECDLKNKSRREEILENVAKELFNIRNRTYSRPCYPFAEAAEPETPYGTTEQI